jgi:hypothetical protein
VTNTPAGSSSEPYIYARRLAGEALFTAKASTLQVDTAQAKRAIGVLADTTNHVDTAVNKIGNQEQQLPSATDMGDPYVSTSVLEYTNTVMTEISVTAQAFGELSSNLNAALASLEAADDEGGVAITGSVTKTAIPSK